MILNIDLRTEYSAVESGDFEIRPCVFCLVCEYDWQISQAA
jgi:hypothetical protein